MSVEPIGWRMSVSFVGEVRLAEIGEILKLVLILVNLLVIFLRIKYAVIYFCLIVLPVWY